jgi:Repeat of unknown function (DUF5648)
MPNHRCALRICSIASFVSLALTACGPAEGPADQTSNSKNTASLLPTGFATKAAPISTIKFSPAPSPTVYRFAKISTGAYFYTGSDEEAAIIINSFPDFRFEGHAFAKQVEGDSLPVYRFANLKNGGYFYTGSKEERDIVIADYSHMRYEGSTFSVAAKALAYADPVYRLANLTNGAYLFTQSEQERDYAVSLGVWRNEGTTFSAEAAIPNGQSVFPDGLYYNFEDRERLYKAEFEASAGWFFPYQSSKRYSLLRKPSANTNILSGLAEFNIGGCGKPLSTYVIEQANTTTYSATDVSEQDHIEAATYAERAAVELKSFHKVDRGVEGFNSLKILVCVQSESIFGAAGIFLNKSSRGLFPAVMLAGSATSHFSVNARTAPTNRDKWRYSQYSYERLFVHELTHAFYATRYPKAIVESWVFEGLARHAESGRQIIPKATILRTLNNENPLLAGFGGLSSIAQYNAASAVIEYLVSPTGANNSIYAFTRIAEQINRESIEYYQVCGFVPLPSGCAPPPTNDALFTKAFEAHIKDTDGTPMLLSGPTGLRATAAKRIEAFW